MHSGFDLVGELTAAVDDRPAVWRFIRRFAAAWKAPLKAGDGLSKVELDAVERRLGLSLPVAMREAYGLFGYRSDLTHNQDRFGVGELRVIDGMLVFRVENQACTHWAVRVDALHHEDPPVFFMDLDTNSWRPFLDRYSLCCLDIVLFEAIMGGDAGRIDNRELDTETAALLETRYPRLMMPAYPTWTNPDGPPVRWFADDDVLLRDEGSTWLWAFARSQPALESLRRALPGDWLCAAP